MAVREPSEARRRAIKKFDAEKVDKATIRLPKGSKEIIKKAGFSVNEYVIRAVVEQLRRDGLLLYYYGMRLRGFSIGCQPKEGFIERQDDETGKYHDILIYNRPLTDKELADYELDYLGGGL